MKEDKVKNLEEASRFTVHESLLLRILLGSSTNPFKFAIAEVQQVQHPAAAGDENKTPENKNSLFNEPKPKGGAKKAVSGELKIKREDIKEYYPPPEFDKHIRGSGTRNFAELRRMIIKEMEDFCGHLYPTKEEKDIVLAAIQRLCGPPDNGPHWNFWTSTENGRVMKHKGMAISDLEKARRDPGAYTCNGIALEGQMRPSRPVRPVPVLPGYMLMTPAPQPAPQGLSPDSFEDNLDDKEAKSEDDILQDAKKRQLEVDQLQKEKEEAKKAKKVSAAAATAAKNAAKKEKKKAENDAKKAAKEAATDATKTSAKRQRTAGPQKDDPVPLSNYEQDRQVTMQANKEYLEFVDKVFENDCKILDKGGDTISNMNIGGFAPDM